MATPRNYIVLSDRNLAVTRNASNVARRVFSQSDISAETHTTVSFETDSPCVAVMDNTGIQWDLDSRRVWYKNGWVTLDLIDIFVAKNMINAESTIDVGIGSVHKIYTRYRAGDTSSGYCWKNDALTPKKYYTRTELPVAEEDYAYETGKIPSLEEDSSSYAKVLIKASVPVNVDPIVGNWDALFAVSVVSGGTGSICNLDFMIVND